MYTNTITIDIIDYIHGIGKLNYCVDNVRSAIFEFIEKLCGTEALHPFY